jgi:hypothetical protein
LIPDRYLAWTPTALRKDAIAGTTEIECALVLFVICSRALVLCGEVSEVGRGGHRYAIDETLLFGVCAGAGVRRAVQHRG